jgi:Rap guanine nucleotide exchange factor 1
MTEDILKQLMDLVFRLVCNGELSLARVLRKNILDKVCFLVHITLDMKGTVRSTAGQIHCHSKRTVVQVEQKKLLRCTNSLKPLAARGVSAR